MTATDDRALEALLREIRACRQCESALAHGPRPVLRARRTARLCLVGQAPGTKVHASGLPFDDASGVRLREWIGLQPAQFYDETKVAIIPMGFCFPGQDRNGGDLAPRKECAPLWRPRLFPLLPKLRLTLLIGTYAQRWHLGKDVRPTLTETVAAWRTFPPSVIPLPHPSWRNTGWLKRHSWFTRDLLPELRQRVREALQGAD